MKVSYRLVNFDDIVGDEIVYVPSLVDDDIGRGCATREAVLEAALKSLGYEVIEN